MQAKFFIELILLVFLALNYGQCMYTKRLEFDNGLESYGPEPYYQNDENYHFNDVNSNYIEDPKKSLYQSDEYYSMRGHDRRPSNVYVKGSMPLEQSKGDPYDTLHHYINDCVGALNTLTKFKKYSLETPYYDIKTHEEREIEYELLTQKFIEILHKMVRLKSADEFVYDRTKQNNFVMNSPPIFTTTPRPTYSSYHGVPIYYSPTHQHLSYLHHQADQSNEFYYEFPEQEHRPYKLIKRRKDKSREEISNEARVDYLKDHFGPSAYHTSVKPGDNLAQPVKITVLDDPLMYKIQIKLEEEHNLPNDSLYKENTNRLESISDQTTIESTTQPERRYWRLKSSKGRNRNRTIFLPNKINVTTDIKNNHINDSKNKEICYLCPSLKPYQYMEKPMLEDNFTNSH